MSQPIDIRISQKNGCLESGGVTWIRYPLMKINTGAMISVARGALRPTTSALD
jgi:hypothetical protein